MKRDFNLKDILNAKSAEDLDIGVQQFKEIAKSADEVIIIYRDKLRNVRFLTTIEDAGLFCGLLTLAQMEYFIRGRE